VAQPGRAPSMAQGAAKYPTWVKLVHIVVWIDLVEGWAEVVRLRVGGGEDLLSGAGSPSAGTLACASPGEGQRDHSVRYASPKKAPLRRHNSTLLSRCTRSVTRYGALGRNATRVPVGSTGSRRRSTAKPHAKNTGIHADTRFHTKNRVG
jgi:hypothetical protein